MDETTVPTNIADADLATATENMFSDAASGDYAAITDYATIHLGPSLVSAAIGLGVIFIGYMVAKYVSRVISGPICRKVDETLGRFVGKMTFYLILMGVTGAVLSSLGAPLGGLAAMLAAAGFAVGLAFQGTLSNFASGVLMMVFRPFKVGDVINAGGVTGKVNEIDLFTTTLDTPDNRRIIVPNSSISGGTIENISFHAHRRVEVCVGVDYSADMDQTRASLEAAVAKFDMATIKGKVVVEPSSWRVLATAPWIGKFACGSLLRTTGAFMNRSRVKSNGNSMRSRSASLSLSLMFTSVVTLRAN